MFHLRQIWAGTFSLPNASLLSSLSGRSLDMAEILLTWTLSRNSIYVYMAEHTYMYAQLFFCELLNRANIVY